VQCFVNARRGWWFQYDGALNNHFCCVQKDNVRNQREHLILLLANAHARLRKPPPDPNGPVRSPSLCWAISSSRHISILHFASCKCYSIPTVYHIICRAVIQPLMCPVCIYNMCSKSWYTILWVLLSLPAGWSGDQGGDEQGVQELQAVVQVPRPKKEPDVSVQRQEKFRSLAS
jgi:hypothetical protein